MSSQSVSDWTKHENKDRLHTKRWCNSNDTLRQICTSCIYYVSFSCVSCVSCIYFFYSSCVLHVCTLAGNNIPILKSRCCCWAKHLFYTTRRRWLTTTNTLNYERIVFVVSAIHFFSCCSLFRSSNMMSDGTTDFALFHSHNLNPGSMFEFEFPFDTERWRRGEFSKHFPRYVAPRDAIKSWYIHQITEICIPGSSLRLW